MGSWEERCVLSGLPIREGDTVRALVTFSPGTTGTTIYHPIQDPVPVAIPLVGKYDGHGGIVDVEDSINTTILRKALGIDLEGTLEGTTFLNRITTSFSRMERGNSGYETSLTFISKDVYDYLSHVDMTEGPSSFIEDSLHNLDHFLMTIQRNYPKALASIENEWYLKLELAEHGLEYFWKISEDDRSFAYYVFFRGEGVGPFSEQWHRYERWIYWRMKDSDLVGNADVRYLFEELLGFHQLGVNMVELGISFRSGPKGLQHVRYDPHITYLEFLLDVAKKGLEGDL